MNVIKCGSKALIKLNKVESVITAISIRFQRISYELTYSHDGEYKTVWCDEDEFESASERIAIGFKS